jgi:hypothetical protein
MIKRFVKTALLTGIPFGLFMGLFFIVVAGNEIGIPAGLFCGLAFGLMIALFTEFQRNKMESKDGTFEGEAIVFQGPANHFFKGEGRGGWLTLTPSRLAFRSHGMNVQNQNIDIGIEELAEVVPTLTLGLIPNGLRVLLKSGEKQSFVVNNRKQWIKVMTIQSGLWET